MKILVLNAGSASLKYKLFDRQKEKYGGKIEGDPHLSFKKLLDKSQFLFEGINAIGHRVVNGGDEFFTPTLMAETNLKKLEKYNKMTPLHNPPAILVIRDCLKAGLQPNYACFDTAFHQTMIDEAKTYPLPLTLTKKYKIQRFGFHGLSHQYIAQMHRDCDRLISVHLGQGCSVCAIKKGKSIDTSMGFTPLEGLPMITRSGSIDPAIIIYLQKEAGFVPSKISEILNNESGIAALAGTNDDFREILASAEYKVEDPHFTLKKQLSNQDIERARFAISYFVYQVAKAIGAYITALQGADKIVFTGEIGAGSGLIREKIQAYFPYLERVRFEAMYTNEELIIAQSIEKCLK